MRAAELSIITPTWNRPALLAHCIRNVREQKSAVSIEHVVVSDGPDPTARALCRHFGIQYAETELHFGDWGKRAIDLGLSVASADYVCFWDDDNLYENIAADVLYHTARGFDMGIARVQLWNRVALQMVIIPEDLDETRKAGFRMMDIDTSSACVRRRFFEEHGVTPGSVAPGVYEADFWLFKKMRDLGATINFSDEIVATHV